MATRTYCNECLEDGKHLFAKYRIPYLTGYDVCQHHYEKMPPALKKLFVK